MKTIYPGFRRTDVNSNGARFERRLFGMCAIFKEPPPCYEFNRALSRARGDQPKRWDPAKPNTEWSAKLMRDVQSFLPPQPTQRLRLYLGLGTSLDFWYGVDAFFQFGERIATIDVTRRDKRPSGYTDFIFFQGNDYDRWHNWCLEIALALVKEKDLAHVQQKRNFAKRLSRTMTIKPTL